MLQEKLLTTRSDHAISLTIILTFFRVLLLQPTTKHYLNLQQSIWTKMPLVTSFKIPLSNLWINLSDLIAMHNIS